MCKIPHPVYVTFHDGVLIERVHEILEAAGASDIQITLNRNGLGFLIAIDINSTSEQTIAKLKEYPEIEIAKLSNKKMCCF